MWEVVNDNLEKTKRAFKITFKRPLTQPYLFNRNEIAEEK